MKDKPERRTRKRAAKRLVKLFLLTGMLTAALFGRVSSNLSAGLEVVDEKNAPSPADASSRDSGILVSELFGNMCQVQIQARAENAQSPSGEQHAKSNALGGDVTPIRSIEDPYPSFNGVAVDPASNLVVLSDTNKKSFLVYDRNSRNKAGEETQPLRQVIGPKTLLGFVAGVAFDAERREIIAVNNDIEDTLMAFDYEDRGNVRPRRILAIPHGAWGISLSKARDEFALSIQDGSTNAVVTYNRQAQGFDPPVRVLHGDNTGLADPHGIYVDDRHNELIVTNWGSWNVTLGRYTTSTREQVELPGGSFREPSIAVYEATVAGDTKPMRLIQGPDTGLNWPTGIDVDPSANELVVANNGEDSVIFFHRTDRGNVKPFRTIKGSKTGIKRPMAVAIDKKNNELWVANFGDHSAVVFDLNASGNAAPKRVIRNAPQGTPTTGFGNPITVAYDQNREELLVPN